MAHRVGLPSGSDGAAPSRGAIVLGVDPGLERTGYAVLDVAADNVIDAGLVRTDTDRPLAERLREIDTGIREILSDHAVSLVAVEDLYAHYKHPKTAILMGHARGVVLLAAAARRIEVMSLAATRVKKALTGNGHASKVQMQRAIMSRLGLARQPEPNDVADAMAVALCAAMERKDREAANIEGVTRG